MKFILLLLVFVHVHSTAMDSTSSFDTFCGLVGMYAVSPDGELEQFLFVGKAKCENQSVEVNISKEWLVTACAYFTTQKHKPTYQIGERLNWSSKIFYYNPARPTVVFPEQNAGVDLSNPVIHVQESIVESEHELCDGKLHKI
ncbi:hypothetical protein [Lacimicrobium alkaliphilum]|uniref:hypothetical protein n=1 Tax=Lacimicrobium alkaliphilum TaxID=1526571 RepID=UPI0012E3A726|nr:hypothetical protein [Lacimicrobium alkaliphilum]